MQIKVVALTKKGEGFPSNKHINAIKKLRTRFDVVDFSRVELKKGFTAVFNAETNYVALVEEIDYVGVIKAFGDGFSNVKIVKYGNALTEFVNLLPNSNNNVETYKLFNVTIPTLESFLVNYSFKYNVKIFDGDVTLKIDFSTLSFEEKDAFLKDFLTKFNDKIYAFYDTTAEKALLDLLTVRGMKLAVAESFTGGNISALISSVSGASKVFYEGVVAYDEDAKKSRLGVQFETLIKYKPVSKQVAYEMCKGLLENDGVDLAISTTGIAGPNSDDSNFPVGLCFIGIGTKEKITVYKFNFNGSREDITAQGVLTAICLAVLNIK